MSGTNVMTIMTGNPVRGQGFFFDAFGRNKEMWFRLTVTVFDSKWSGGQKYADQIAATYGENSNAYRVRVLGEFPTADDDTVIPFELVESSLGREVEPHKVRPIWGVDVAHMGSDRSTLAKRRGNALIEAPKSWTKLEPDEVAARIYTEWQHTPESERPIVINVDLIGYGTGVVASLKALGLPARGINVAEAAATNADIYRNLRTELYFKTREWFAEKDVVFPKSVAKDDNMDQLIRELTMVRYKFTPQSRKLYIESKDDLRRRGHRSPDLADAFVLTFAGDAITLAQGAKAAYTNWKRPIAKPNRTLI
jgi:phage terminase large subunit